MYVVDMFLISLVFCKRMMLGLLCRVFLSSMMHGRLKLMCLVFHVMMCVLVVAVLVFCGCSGCACVYFGWM